ncbi:MAG: hypothetical protein IJ072_07200 [Oscillospiraceae bacterium]|nr:hypothetical protein [Oscillospiraceae bacterium]
MVNSALKAYVPVVARFDKVGRMIPMSIEWEDGRIYNIERVLDIRRAASLRAGGMGTRYRIRMENGKETFLFYEDKAWFVERKN